MSAQRDTIPAPTELAPRRVTALVMSLYALAGRWEAGASVTERSTTLGRVEREASADQLRRCADQLLAILDGQRA
jgi:hypothetical protein